MKSFTAVFIILILILTGVFWFVNRELATFPSFTTESNRENKKTVGKDFDGWRFAVIGDLEGPNGMTDTILNQLSQENIEFVIHTGDIVNTGEEKEKRKNILTMQEKIDTLPFPFYTLPGNNEMVYDENLEIRTHALYKELINENLYTQFDFNNVRFFLLDNSYRRFGFDDTELQWLEKNLKNNSQPFTLLFYHRPIDVPGQEFFGDDETKFSREQNAKFKNVIQNYTIDHIFNGHIHSTLQYNLQGIPVTVSGGGGAIPQAILGGEDAAFFHYYIVSVPNDPRQKIKTELRTIK